MAARSRGLPVTRRFPIPLPSHGNHLETLVWIHDVAGFKRHHEGVFLVSDLPRERSMCRYLPRRGTKGAPASALGVVVLNRTMTMLRYSGRA